MNRGYRRCFGCAVHRKQGEPCAYCGAWVCSMCQVEIRNRNGIDISCAPCGVVDVPSGDDTAVRASEAIEGMQASTSRPSPNKTNNMSTNGN
eukprot:3837749-Amphidinium_carterae.1